MPTGPEKGLVATTEQKNKWTASSFPVQMSIQMSIQGNSLIPSSWEKLKQKEMLDQRDECVITLFT